jgi:carbon monoxide dehydrogenase subunit G
MRALQPLALAEFDAAPFRYVASGYIAGSPRAVFDELGDPSKWFPMMTHCVWTTAETGGVGAEREVTVRVFGKFHARMLVWEPERRVAFSMIGTTSRLVAQMGEDLRLAPDGDGVRLDWIVAAKLTALGRATPGLRLILGRMFAGLRRNLETRCSRLGAADARGKEVS